MRFLEKQTIIRTGYMSEVDRFLREFDERRHIQGSRLQEVEKHKIIFAKRDGIIDETEDALWEQF